MLDQLRRRWRVRALASDKSAGAWARAKVRDLWWDFARRSWQFLAATAAIGLGITILILAFVPGDLRRGFFAGVAVTMTIGGIWAFVAYMSGSASTTMGAIAEQWTASELRTLTRSGWLVINGLQLRIADIDHVLVGPAGVIAVETKWSRDPWRIDPPSASLTDAAGQVRRNAWDLQHWEDLKRLHAAPVRAALFLWSAARVPDPKPTTYERRDEVSVVYGSDARRSWLDAVRDAPANPIFTPEHIEKVWAALNGHLLYREERRTGERPLPTIARIYWTGLGILLAAGGAFLLTASVFAGSGPWIWAVCCLAITGCAGLLSRIGAARPFSVATIAGIATNALYIAGLEVYFLVR